MSHYIIRNADHPVIERYRYAFLEAVRRTCPEVLEILREHSNADRWALQLGFSEAWIRGYASATLMTWQSNPVAVDGLYVFSPAQRQQGYGVEFTFKTPYLVGEVSDWTRFESSLLDTIKKELREWRDKNFVRLQLKHSDTHFLWLALRRCKGLTYTQIAEWNANGGMLEVGVEWRSEGAGEDQIRKACDAAAALIGLESAFLEPDMKSAKTVSC